MQRVTYNFNAEKNLDILSKSAFLTTKYGDKINTMVIGWGTIGTMWGLPVFIAMVRKSRFSYELLQKAHEFTVTLPYGELPPSALTVCGEASGRTMDKLAACGLSVCPGQKMNTPVLDLPGMHFECKTVYERPMGEENLNKALNELWYTKNPDNYHVFFIGEIVDSYIIE